MLEIDFETVTTLLHGILSDGKIQRNVSCGESTSKTKLLSERRTRKNRFNRLYSKQPIIAMPVFGITSLRCRLRIRSQKSKWFFLVKTGKKEIIWKPLHATLLTIRMRKTKITYAHNSFTHFFFSHKNLRPNNTIRYKRQKSFSKRVICVFTIILTVK